MFELIDQQADFIVINKSANSSFHDEGDTGNGLFSTVKTQLNLAELFPVHRLDKMTSGLLILATNKPAAAHFQTLFSQHQVEKYYLAISDQKPKKKQGLIKGDMAKSRRGMWKLLRTQDNPAITQFFSHSLGNGLRGFILKPHSGKTHQIRVALASIGAPILGDPLYSKSASDRGYLHAFSLRFTLNNTPYHYSLIPEYGSAFQLPTCQQWLATLTQPWLLPWPSI
ncbi:TIGR01621 family pseudouridine synthase [Colwellia sp. MEBiC06753]